MGLNRACGVGVTRGAGVNVGTGVGESIIVGDGDGNDGVMVAAAAAVGLIGGRSLGVGKDATRIRYALRDGLM